MKKAVWLESDMAWMEEAEHDLKFPTPKQGIVLQCLSCGGWYVAEWNSTAEQYEWVKHHELFVRIFHHKDWKAIKNNSKEN